MEGTVCSVGMANAPSDGQVMGVSRVANTFER